MTQATQDATDNFIRLAERWFTHGWLGEVAMAPDIFSERLMTNGVLVGVAGPVTRIRDRLRGFPDLSTIIEEMFRADDTVVTRLLWRGTHTGPYGGVPPTARRVEIRDMAIWHFADGKVAEIWTLQDHFGFLKQVGCLQEGLYAA